MRQFARNELVVFALALQFLTRIPISVGQHFSAARLAAAPRYYTLVGALVGTLCAVLASLTQTLFTPTVAVLLALAAGLLITGAFHEDGLADTFDGMGSLDRDGALKIMRDSRIGTYGSLALVMAIALKATTLSALAPERLAMALIVAHGLSRLSAVLVIASSQYVRDQGVAKPTAAGIGSGGLAVALISGAVLLSYPLVAEGAASALWILAGGLMGHVAMRALFERRLGGYTGDTLGAVQQTSELGIYLGMLAWQ